MRIVDRVLQGGDSTLDSCGRQLDQRRHCCLLDRRIVRPESTRQRLDCPRVSSRSELATRLDRPLQALTDHFAERLAEQGESRRRRGANLGEPVARHRQEPGHCAPITDCTQRARGLRPDGGAGIAQHRNQRLDLTRPSHLGEGAGDQGADTLIRTGQRLAQSRGAVAAHCHQRLRRCSARLNVPQCPHQRIDGAGVATPGQLPARLERPLQTLPDHMTEGLAERGKGLRAGLPHARVHIGGGREQGEDGARVAELSESAGRIPARLGISGSERPEFRIEACPRGRLTEKPEDHQERKIKDARPQRLASHPPSSPPGGLRPEESPGSPRQRADEPSRSGGDRGPHTLEDPPARAGP